MSDPQVTGRLDRLETKIDKISEVLTMLARVEEQINGQNARLKRHEWRLDENEKKIEETAEQVAQNASTARTAEKIFFSIWAGFWIFFRTIFWFGFQKNTYENRQIFVNPRGRKKQPTYEF